MNTYTLQIIIFVLVYLLHVRCQSTDTTVITASGSSIVSTMMTSELSSSFISNPTTAVTIQTSLLTSITTATNPSSVSNTAVPTSIQSFPSNTAVTTSIQSFPSNTAVPTSIQSSPSNSISGVTIVSTSVGSPSTGNSTLISSTSITSVSYITSPNTNTATQQPSSSLSSSATSQTTVTALKTNLILVFKYSVASSAPLKIGNVTNNTVFSNVQNIVRSSFSLSNFTINLISLEVRVQAKATNLNDVYTTIQFQSLSIACNANCIQNTASTPNQPFQLPTDSGTLINAIAQSAPQLITTPPTTATTTRTIIKGDPPPGTPAKIGMGVGITLIGLLLIGETVFLYRKYGVRSSAGRQRDYELPAYHNN